MSTKFIFATLNGRHSVGDIITLNGKTYEVASRALPNGEHICMTVGFWSRAWLALAALWPFHFSGFWARVWGR